MKTSAGFPRRVHHRLHPVLYLGGSWFITICSHGRRENFSVIEEGTVRLLPLGRIIAEEWARVALRRPEVTLDESVVMPNHFHGIVHLPRPTTREAEPVRFARLRRSLGSLVGGFKSAVTSRVRELYGPDFVVWQEGFYDHGVRDEHDLERIREYIRNNPAKWEDDPDNRRNG